MSNSAMLLVVLCVFNILSGSASTYDGEWTPMTQSPWSSAWHFVACNANCEHMAAAVYGGGLFVSKDFGENFSISNGAPNVKWSQLALEALGMVQYAVAESDGVFRSVNCGAMFFNVLKGETSSVLWNSVAASADGVLVFAGAGTKQVGQGLFHSADSGNTWAKYNEGGDNVTSASVFAIGLSSTAQYVVVATTFSGVHVSSNFGAKFNSIQSFVGTGSYQAVAVSGSGQYMLLGGATANYLSLNYGETWELLAFKTKVTSFAATKSFDLIFATTSSGIFFSTDMGMTWTLSASAPTNLSYTSVAIAHTVNTTDTTVAFAAASDGPHLFRHGHQL